MYIYLDIFEMNSDLFKILYTSSLNIYFFTTHGV